MKILLYTILILAVNLAIVYLAAQILPGNSDGLGAFAQAIANALIGFVILIIIEFVIASNYWKRKKEIAISFLLAAIITLGFAIWEAIFI